jgi:proline iminopeptidase
MNDRYPEIEPFDSGMLDVGDGNLVYWEVCGNPDGKPAVALHGGPGSGWNTGFRRHFDPAAYRLVLFDQRGSGRSTPHASEPTTDLGYNTTEHLLGDIERLRHHLGIDRWLVFGGSWGATLALAYAERSPLLVSEIILVGVTTTRRSEIDWLYHGVALLFPEEWERFRAGVPPAERDGNLVEAYSRLLEDPDPAIRAKAAQDWCDWEISLVSPDPGYRPSSRWSRPEWQMAFARLVTHYFRHGAWLEEGILLQEAGSLAGIPGVLIHGRLDFGAPLTTAWELARAWPDAELVIVSGAGHDSGHQGMTESLLAATDRFAARR